MPAASRTTYGSGQDSRISEGETDQTGMGTIMFMVTWGSTCELPHNNPVSPDFVTCFFGYIFLVTLEIPARAGLVTG